MPSPCFNSARIAGKERLWKCLRWHGHVCDNERSDGGFLRVELDTLDGKVTARCEQGPLFRGVSSMNTAEQLQKLQELRQTGALSDEEYAKAKADVLNAPPAAAGTTHDEVEKQTKLWAMLLHLSQLAHFAAGAGLIIPIVIWQIKKAELPGIDVHGKIVVNWLISAIIYLVVGVILTPVFVGFVIVFAVGIVAFVFPIIGGVKASSGEVWKYPLSIPFFK